MSTGQVNVTVAGFAPAPNRGDGHPVVNTDGQPFFSDRYCEHTGLSAHSCFKGNGPSLMYANSSPAKLISKSRGNCCPQN